MIRKTTISLILLSATLSASAGTADSPKVERWLRRAMTQCPSPTWDFASVDEGVPAGISAYRLRQSSTTSSCKETMFALVTESGQILAGQVVPLAAGTSDPAGAIKKLFSERLNVEVDVKLAATPLPDGVREVVISKKSPTGAVPIEGWLDPTQTLFVMGRRGSIDRDAGMTLLDDLEASKGISTGPANAQIRIVELSDLQCPACRRGHEIVAPLLQKHGDRIHYTRLDLPISDSHDWTMRASQAAVAIRRLAPDHYWKFIDMIFASQPTITTDSLDGIIRDYVEGIGLDWITFARVYESRAVRNELNEQVGRAFSNGIFATPTFLVNGRAVYYGPGGEDLEAYLNSLVKN